MGWRRYLRRDARRAELADEIAQYIAQETEDNLARGMTLEAARQAARRKFGNPAAIHEAVYRMNTVNWFDALAQDVRYGWRQLRRRRGFALAAVLSLALGIGANTAIFTLVDQILLRLLPVEDPRALVQLRIDGIRPGGNSGDGRHTFPYPTYLALKDRNTVFAGLTGQRIEAVTLVDHERSELVTLALVSGNYFEVLGVGAHLGRLITPADDGTLNGQPVAVLQYDFWQSQYLGRAGIVGETIRLNGSPFTVIGIAAREFEGTDVGTPTKIFVPVTMQPAVAPNLPPLTDDRVAWFYPFARLRPGVTIEQAEAAMKVLYRQRQHEELQQPYFGRYPETRDGFLRQAFSLEPAERGASGLRARFERPLLVLEWLAAAVLLIACANIAGLLLARGAASQRDLAIRRAIGASRGRLIAQLFTESALVAAIGAGAGLFVGAQLTRLLIALLPDGAELSLSATPDARVLAFTVIVTVATAMIFGLLPAWQNSRAPVAALRETVMAVGGGRSHVRFRKAFVGLQVALSAMLLLGAGLFVRSLMNLRQVELGLQPGNVVTFLVRPAAPFDNARKIHAYRALLEELGRVPGVAAVGASRTQLFTGGRWDGPLEVAGGVDGDSAADSFFNAVTPGYFEALRLPIKAGAGFAWRDWGSGKRQAIVNDSLTATYFGGRPPLGRMVGIGTRSPTDIEIVGVVADARYEDVRGQIPRQTFFNMDGMTERITRVSVYARVEGDPDRVMPHLREAVRTADPNFVVSGMRTLDDQVGSRMSNERILSLLSLGFALLATVLAVVGLHGVLVFQVARRTREIGIRMALGARRGIIVRLVAGEMTVVVACGLAAGVGAGYAGGRLVRTQLFGVDPADPLVFGLAIGALLAAAAAATLLPAWRAARIDPTHALRCE